MKFVTEPYTAQGICRVLRYEGGQQCQNPRYVIWKRSLRLNSLDFFLLGKRNDDDDIKAN